MIEIVLDETAENVFLNKSCPVYVVNGDEKKSWSDYRVLAHDVVATYNTEKTLIIRNNNPLFSINWFAVALFVESCLVETDLECVVFKTENRQAALKAYRPFIALTISLKYVIRLYQEELPDIYREIAILSYLGLNIKENYAENKLSMELPAEGELFTFNTETTEEALVAVGVLKSLALAQIPVHITAEIVKNDKSPVPDINKVIDTIVDFVQQWIA